MARNRLLMEPEESSSPTKKPLDPLVKTALSISVGLIVITVIGMILTAPDRSIPPYSVMAQAGDIVTVSVPPGTTDTEIEALLVRFRAIRSEGREFQRLKIKPTTPKEPNARYDRLTIYIMANPGLAEDAVLHDYLAGNDPTAKASFERGVRGLYHLTPQTEFAAVGFVPGDARSWTGQTPTRRVLFEERLDGK